MEVLPRWVPEIAETVVAVYESVPHLAWIHGQGSVFCGFSQDSDLDLIAVWDGPLPAVGSGLSSGFERTASGQMVLEQGLIADRQVDVLHIPLSTFEGWAVAVADGRGWQQPMEWPLPLHAIAGFVYGVTLCEPHGLAARAARRSAGPSATLVDSLTLSLGEQLPVFVAELRRCADQGHSWLHGHLASQILRQIYLTWFAREGRYCPFLKHLPGWFRRFRFEPDLVALEHRLWATATTSPRTDHIERLGTLVLNLHHGLAATGVIA